MPNPFFYGGRIENPNDFIGRKAELRAIFSALETFSAGQAQHVSVVGERRIGKSSLLYYVTQTYPQRLSQPECYRFVFVDLDGANNHTIAGLLGFILKKLDLPTGSHPSLSEFSDTLEMLHDKKHVCPVICLDEFEHLVEHKEEFPNAVYEAFRSLGSNNKAAFLTASRSQLSELIHQSNMTSTFPNIFIQQTLKVFGREEAIQLLEKSVPPFSTAEKEQILQISGYQPGKLQFVARTVYDKRDEGVINWNEIRDKCNHQTGIVRPNNSIKNKTTNFLKVSIVAIFLRLPQMIGKLFLEIYYKDKDKGSDRSALFFGYLIILFIFLFLTGVISIEKLMQFKQEL